MEKDYEKYYLRARDEEKVRFIKSRVHTVDEDRETGDLILNYVDEQGGMQQEVFDMVILSVGLEIPWENRELAASIGVATDAYGFARTSPFNPLETTRPGVFVSGVFQGPKDIPSSVTEASGAACAAGMALATSRGYLYPQCGGWWRRGTFPVKRPVLVYLSVNAASTLPVLWMWMQWPRMPVHCPGWCTPA